MKKGAIYISTTFLSILSFFASAQIYTFDALSEVLYNYHRLTPEALMLDPVYTPDNRIVGYTLGNMIKVAYAPFGSEYPEERTVSVWDSKNMDWTPTHKDTYTYNHAKQLTEKTVRIPAYSTFTLEPVYTSSYLYSRKGNTLSIREIRKEDAKSDTTTITCYLNRHEQPDSVIHAYQDKIYLKTIYTYNRKKQPVRIAGYYKDKTLPKYLYTFNTEIEYRKNSLLYKFTLTPEAHAYQQGESMDFTDNKHAPVTYMSQTSMEITLDKKKRITSKKIMHQDTLILETHYTYDSKGRQHVEATYRTFPSQMFPGNNNLEAWSVGDITYTVTYDKDDFRIMEIFPNSGNKNKEAQPEIIKKDKTATDGKIWYYENNNYRSYEGAFTSRDLALFHYSKEKNGVSVKEKEHYRTSSEKEEIMKHGHHREITKTDSLGRMISIETYTYNNALKTWEERNLRTLSYDRNGNTIREEKLFYDHSDKEWKGWEAYSRIYDEQGRILCEKIPVWEEGKWQDHECFRYAYDENGNRTLEEKMMYNSFLEEWYGEYKASSTYDTEGRLTSKTNYTWESYKNDWLPWKKKEQIWEAYSQETTEYLWEISTGTWLPEEKRYEYTKQTPLKEEIYKSWNWNKENKGWQPQVERYRQQPADTISETREYRWDNTLKKLAGEEYITSRTAADSIIKIYHIWDTTEDIWLPRLRYTEIHSLPDSITGKPSVSEYLFEAYNALSRQWVYDQRIYIFTEFEKTDPKGNILVNRSGELYRWQPERRIWNKQFSVFSNEDKYGLDRNVAEHFIYTNAGDKIPLYSYKKDGNKNEKMYSVWDKKTASYRPFYKKAEKGQRMNHIFLWDTASGKWIDNEEYREKNPAKRKKALDYIDATLNDDLFYINPNLMIYPYLQTGD